MHAITYIAFLGSVIALDDCFYIRHQNLMHLCHASASLTFVGIKSSQSILTYKLLLERKNMPGQIFHSNICQNQLDTCKISDFRKLQNIIVNVISLPVMTPDKFS